MKKYLVWKSGSAPTAGVVVTADNSFDARLSVARQRNEDNVRRGRDPLFHSTDFCARLVPDHDAIVADALKHIGELVHVAPPPVSIKRCWVNQPSTLQKLHKHHGKNVLVAFNHEGYETVVYFLDGDIVSIAGDYAACLSEGWRERAPEKPVNKLTHADARALRAKIELLVDAEVNYAFKGCLVDAADKKTVTTEREYARGSLENLIKELTK